MQNAKKYLITSGLYVPGNQIRMLKKCVTTNATLIVPDMEVSEIESKVNETIGLSATSGETNISPEDQRAFVDDPQRS